MIAVRVSVIPRILIVIPFLFIGCANFEWSSDTCLGTPIATVYDDKGDIKILRANDC
jgi:hypothetical protein